MTLPANIRVQLNAPFPALVTGKDLVSITKANGVWTIGIDYTGLQDLPVGLGSAYLVVFDPQSGAFYKVTAANLNTFTAAGGVFLSQIKQNLATVDITAPKVIGDNIPDDPYDHVNICWNAITSAIGDALYTFIKSRLFAGSDVSTINFYASASALPVTPL